MIKAGKKTIFYSQQDITCLIWLVPVGCILMCLEVTSEMVPTDRVTYRVIMGGEPTATLAH